MKQNTMWLKEIRSDSKIVHHVKEEISLFCPFNILSEFQWIERQVPDPKSESLDLSKFQTRKRLYDTVEGVFNDSLISKKTLCMNLFL